MNDTIAAAIPMGLSVIGGLGIFMLGMKNMSEGMQAVAGGSLRRLISLVTDHRLTATGAGTLVTVLVQSSTVTTVIVLGLVNAGHMQLHQAIGVILGANIGTTITGWILVLKIGKYGLPILGVAALVYLFARRDRLRFIAMAIMGLGMIFFGLELMKDGFGPMKDMPAFMDAFAWFQADTYVGVLKCVLVGCILTFLVQSSSATLGITIGLAATGVIPFPTAAALVLGENIGTTTTVLLASIGANTNTKRAGLAHVLFNVFGVFWITLLFPWYIQLISGFVEAAHGVNPMLARLPDFADPLEFGVVITAAIASTHTGFNVVNTLLFLPFLGPYAKLLVRLVPDRRAKEVRRLSSLDARVVAAPVLGLEQSRGEVVQMGRGVVKMSEWIRQLAFNGPFDEGLIRKTFHREEVLDNVQMEIVTFLTNVLDANVPRSIAEEARQQLRIAHEYESISDRLSEILRLYLKLREDRLQLPAVQAAGLQDLHDAVADFVRRAADAYERGETPHQTVFQQAAADIKDRIEKLRDDHVQRMIDNAIEPKLTLTFTALLADYRRIRAHATNVFEACGG